MLNFSPNRWSTVTVAGTTSRPIPSPGITAIVNILGLPVVIKFAFRILPQPSGIEVRPVVAAVGACPAGRGPQSYFRRTISAVPRLRDRRCKRNYLSRVCGHGLAMKTAALSFRAQRKNQHQHKDRKALKACQRPPVSNPVA